MPLMYIFFFPELSVRPFIYKECRRNSSFQLSCTCLPDVCPTFAVLATVKRCPSTMFVCFLKFRSLGSLPLIVVTSPLNRGLVSHLSCCIHENFVVQSLIRIYGANPHYWANDRYEVDFIIQSGNDIFPIELMSGHF